MPLPAAAMLTSPAPPRCDRPTFASAAGRGTLVLPALLLLLAAPIPVAAQDARGWDAAPARELAERATERRALQLADTVLRDYQALARGFLTFLAQVGDGFPDPPRVVKADQLAVEVYWAAPQRSKQIVVGRRDTLLLPGDIDYYRDRFGIVQNNFPDIIRLGDGNDVSDVPHPLSVTGLREYLFALGDSITIRVAGQSISVVEVRFRPRDDRQPRAVGTLYIDRENASVARMALTFTQAAILDRRIETLAVTLENGLVEGRFWLPRRQELEVARTATWLDFPARGIIRGRWEVGDYRVNQGVAPDIFAGPEIVAGAPRRQLEQYEFEGSLLSALPEDVAVATDADVQRVRRQAAELVRQRALSRAPGASLSARRVSDFVRVNRVEGLALGAGVQLRPRPRTALTIRGRYGLDDEAVKGGATLAIDRVVGRRLELFAERSYRDAGDVQETSLVRNSLAAQEFGSDYTDPFDVRTAGMALGSGERLGIRWRVEGAWERHRPLEVNATPATGRYAPTLPVAAVEGARVSLFADRLPAAAPLGLELRWSAELRGGDFGEGARFGRLLLRSEAERPAAGGMLVLEALAAGLLGAALPQQLAYFGGPRSGPGYAFHSLAGRAGGSVRAEWRHAVPFTSIPLGRFGRSPATMTLAPYLHLVAADGDAGVRRHPGGVYPSVGVGGLFLFDLVRVDVARGVRDGRWTFGLDVTRTLWGIF